MGPSGPHSVAGFGRRLVRGFGSHGVSPLSGLSALQAQADAEGDVDRRVSIDCTVARVHQHGATARRPIGPSGRSSSAGLSHTGGATG